MRKFFGTAMTLSLGFCLFTVSPLFAKNGSVLITRVQGSAQIMRDQKAMPAKEGMAVQQGDILKTGPDCTLDISMNDLVGGRMLPGSECEIDKTKPKSMKLKITNGNTILNLERLPEGSEFKIETPTAVAAARGTQFWGRVDAQNVDNPVTTFAVREGAVQILAKGAGKYFMLNPGQALDIPKQGTAAPIVRAALEEEMAAMQQASSIKTSA